ncbi:hypothetical protein FE697_020590 [Mumia zhuanghuii]|uniref:Uncharacterized protein n=2 Tax=Mumia TaxID=1546255 RepID=A0ABW1QJC2_9ACTN|nr:MULTISPECIES: hypothetical protein [Mumia]KAA1418232.1 hypothetical protein FE697_020590 [Mumia zhuanghuii]
MSSRRIFGAIIALVASLGLVAVATTPAEAHSRHKTGYTQVVVAPEVYELVAGAGITPAAIGGAKAFPYKNTLAARFPITGYSVSKLRIKHSGGISLTAGSATISLKRFNIDLGRLRVSGKVSGTVGDVGRVDLFKIRLSDRRGLGLVRLTLTDTAAGALNATFGVDAFSAGDTFGYATPRPFSRF